MKKSKKLVALLIVVIMAMAMLPLTSFASFKVADPDPIVATYVDSDGTEKEAAAVPLTADMTELTSGWYIVNENILMEDEKTHTAKGITITGDVKLIIADTGFLSIMEPVDAPAIKVVCDNKLTIYGQGQKNGNGVIHAYGGKNSAGIGGGAYENSGTIVINSGSVHAVGGKDGAGIGGGLSAAGTNITINGGTINCISGENGAAIGGGHYGYGSNITINGGQVSCCASEDGGTGLGGGVMGKTENIAINGGLTAMHCENASNALGDTASSGGIENVFIADNCCIWTTPETSGQTYSYGFSHSSTEDLSATLSDKTEIIVCDISLLHVHDWVFGTIDNKMVAICMADDCWKQECALELNAETVVYDGQRHGATLSNTAEWKNAGLEVPEIKYVGRKGTVYSETTKAPATAGKYSAKIVVGEDNCTLTVDYEITPAKMNVTAAKVNSVEANTISLNPVVINGINDKVIPSAVAEYAISKTNEVPETGWQTSTEFAELDSDTTYYVFVRVSACENYEEYVSEGAMVLTIEVIAEQEEESPIQTVFASIRRFFAKIVDFFSRFRLGL